MAQEVRFTRITNSTRLTDRYLTIQQKESSDPDKTSMGKIFALVEITNPWFPNSQIGQAIINALTQEYYKLPENDALDNFEASLKKVNGTLSHIAQKGDIDWIGNTNAILALIKDGEMHLTQTGKAEAYLFRNNKINHIVESSNQELEPHPLKTFSNIISGELSRNDKILITSPALLDYLSQKELQEIIINNSTYDAAKEIAQFLKKEKARHINAVVIESIVTSDLENQPLQKDEVVYLDQVSSVSTFLSSSKKYSAQIAPFFESISKSISESWGKTLQFFKKEIAPRTKSTWEKTKELSQKGYDHLKTKTAPQVKEILKPVADKIGQSFNKPKEKVEVKDPYSVHYYEEKRSKSFLEQKLEPFAKNTRSILSKSIRATREAFNWLFCKQNRSVLYVCIAIILTLILVVNIEQLKKHQNIKKQEAEQAQLLNDTQKKFEDAKLAILYNDANKAKTLLNDTITSATEIMKSQPKLSDLAKTIINNANTEFDKLTDTTRFNQPQLIADFPEVSKIFVIKDKLSAVNTKNNILYYTSPDGEATISQTQGPQESDGIYQTIGFNDKNNSILALSNQNKLFDISDATVTPGILNLAKGNWESGNDIDLFLNSVYILDSTAGQIYKHNLGTNGYGSLSNYVDSSQVDLKNAISMTIDGSIFVLKSDNSLIKLSRGTQQDFDLHDIPTPTDKITKAKKVWTTSEINSIFVLDDNRIIESDKTGKFLHQYAFSPDLQNITDFFINAQDKKMWILNDKKVYKVNY